jgi:hypothetical protein
MYGFFPKEEGWGVLGVGYFGRDSENRSILDGVDYRCRFT